MRLLRLCELNGDAHSVLDAVWNGEGEHSPRGAQPQPFAGLVLGRDVPNAAPAPFGRRGGRFAGRPRRARLDAARMHPSVRGPAPAGRQRAVARLHQVVVPLEQLAELFPALGAAFGAVSVQGLGPPGVEQDRFRPFVEVVLAEGKGVRADAAPTRADQELHQHNQLRFFAKPAIQQVPSGAQHGVEQAVKPRASADARPPLRPHRFQARPDLPRLGMPAGGGAPGAGAPDLHQALEHGAQLRREHGRHRLEHVDLGGVLRGERPAHRARIGKGKVRVAIGTLLQQKAEDALEEQGLRARESRPGPLRRVADGRRAPPRAKERSGLVVAQEAERVFPRQLRVGAHLDGRIGV